jgi:hypothetical protein
MMLHTTKRSNRGSLTLALLVGLSGGTASAAAFRLSFLDDKPVLEDTCQLLKEHGFSEDAARTFSKLVEHHNRNGNRVDRTHFPACQSGYYQFLSLADLTNRLSCCFYETPADRSLDQNTLMCFDVACLLLRGAGSGASLFDQGFESKGIVLLREDGDPRPVNYKAFCSDNHLLYPSNGYPYFVGRPRSQAETQLGLALRAPRRLSDDDADVDSSVQAALATYVKAVQRDGFAFPREFRLGLAYHVSLKRRYIRGDHAFICIPKNERLVCLEKNGSKGPYVRVEFASEEDLGRYMSWSLLQEASNPKDDAYGCAVVVSLNDRLVRTYLPVSQSSAGSGVSSRPNPQGGANGSQPIRSEINRTSSAAGSRRSP